MFANSTRCRRAAPCLAVRLVSAVGLLLALVLGSYGTRAHAADPYIFQSSASGTSGGGLIVSSTRASGYTFRVTRRYQVTEVGAQLSTYQPSSSPTVYIAIHRVGTPISTPEVITDSNLVAATTLTVDSSTSSDRTANLSATLEPGWYSVTLGTGRHGATAASGLVSAESTGHARPANVFGLYSVNTETNAYNTQSVTVRVFVRGNTLPDALPDTDLFLTQTTQPYALSGSATQELDADNWIAHRFEVTQPVHVGRVSSWFRKSTSGGRIFAAIVRVASTDADIPEPYTQAFTNALVATTTIDVGIFNEEYAGLFDDVALPPGHYAVVLGSGQYGANGEVPVMGLANNGNILHTTDVWHSATTGWSPDARTRIALEGLVSKMVATPDPVDFGGVLLGLDVAQQVTVSNTGTEDATLGTIALDGTDAAQFSLDADVSACSGQTLATQASCSFTLHYHPAAVGSHVAEIDIANDSAPSPLTVTVAGEGLLSHVVTPTAGAGGAIAPDTPQIVADSAQPVFQLSPDDHYHIASVTGSCGGGLVGTTFTTDTVSGDCSVDANFAIDSFTLSYAAGPNGSISGSASQTVDYGNSGTPVTAVPATGHHFTGWSDGRTDNPRTDANVSADVTVTANFAADTFTLSYAAGPNGSISGSATQTVDYGTSGTAVEAVADSGHHFTGWSDGRTDNPRTDANVSADVAVTANFAAAQLTVTVNVDGGHGSITPPTQVVDYGASATFAVIPDDGYRIAGVTGCGGTLSGNTYRTGAINANCTIVARFAAALAAPVAVPATGWQIRLLLAGLLGMLAVLLLRPKP